MFLNAYVIFGTKQHQLMNVNQKSGVDCDVNRVVSAKVSCIRASVVTATLCFPYSLFFVALAVASGFSLWAAGKSCVIVPVGVEIGFWSFCLFTYREMSVYEDTKTQKYT